MKPPVGILISLLTMAVSATVSHSVSTIQYGDLPTSTIIKTYYQTTVRQLSSNMMLPLGNTEKLQVETPSSLKPQGQVPTITQRPISGIPVIFDARKQGAFPTKDAKREASPRVTLSSAVCHIEYPKKRNSTLYGLRIHISSTGGYISIYLPKEAAVAFCQSVPEATSENAGKLQTNDLDHYYDITLAMGNELADSKVVVQEKSAVAFCRQFKLNKNDGKMSSKLSTATTKSSHARITETGKTVNHIKTVTGSKILTSKASTKPTAEALTSVEPTHASLGILPSSLHSGRDRLEPTLTNPQEEEDSTTAKISTMKSVISGKATPSTTKPPSLGDKGDMEKSKVVSTVTNSNGHSSTTRTVSVKATSERRAPLSAEDSNNETSGLRDPGTPLTSMAPEPAHNGEEEEPDNSSYLKATRMSLLSAAQAQQESQDNRESFSDSSEVHCKMTEPAQAEDAMGAETPKLNMISRPMPSSNAALPRARVPGLSKIQAKIRNVTKTVETWSRRARQRDTGDEDQGITIDNETDNPVMDENEDDQHENSDLSVQQNSEAIAQETPVPTTEGGEAVPSNEDILSTEKASNDGNNPAGSQSSADASDEQGSATNEESSPKATPETEEKQSPPIHDDLLPANQPSAKVNPISSSTSDSAPDEKSSHTSLPLGHVAATSTRTTHPYISTTPPSSPVLNSEVSFDLLSSSSTDLASKNKDKGKDKTRTAVESSIAAGATNISLPPIPSHMIAHPTVPIIWNPDCSTTPVSSTTTAPSHHKANPDAYTDNDESPASRMKGCWAFVSPPGSPDNKKGDMDKEAASMAWGKIHDSRVVWTVMLGWTLVGLEVFLGLWEFMRGVRGDPHVGRKLVGLWVGR